MSAKFTLFFADSTAGKNDSFLAKREAGTARKCPQI